jgi:membrane associated rhomboid family serine protease
MDPQLDDGPPRAREPLLNAPWASLVVVAAILLSYLLQSRLADGEGIILAWGFSPATLDQGRWSTLFTMMFLHGGWTHAITNAAGALAFGPPVARLLGDRAKGVIGFFAFYLLCGALACLGYAALNAHDPVPLIGASGAVSGLMGGASRLLGQDGRLAPIWSRGAVSLGLAYIVVNALLALTGVTPLMPGAKIGWEAHIVGFLAGLVLVGPFARVFGRPHAEVVT